MLSNYFPVLVFLVIALGIAIVPIILGFLLAPSKPDKEKYSQYECGFEPFEDARIKFDIRYYLVAILFIIFDLEIAFLFPWSVVLDVIPLEAIIAMLMFLGLLGVGFIYEWKKGALEWE